MRIHASITTLPRRALLLLCLYLAPAATGVYAQVDLDKVSQCMRDNMPRSLHVGSLSLVAGGGQQMRGSLSATSDAAGKRLLWSINAPSELAGSAVLTREDGDGPVSYLYLPSLGRVRRIEQADQEGRMFGTDISYGDAERIASSFAGSALTVLGVTRFGERPAWNIAATASPGAANAYDEIDLVVDQKICVTLQADLMKNEEVLKRWTVDPASITQSGRYWYAASGIMTDLQRHTETRVRFSQVSMDTQLPEPAFNPRSFYRSR